MDATTIPWSNLIKLLTCFFKNISKFDKLLTKETKQKKKTQFINIRNERWPITTDYMRIQQIIRKYYNKFHGHKFNNLNEINQFIETHNLPKSSQRQIDNLSRFVSIEEAESINNNFPNQKEPDSNGFTGQSYQTLKNK